MSLRLRRFIAEGFGIKLTWLSRPQRWDDLPELAKEQPGVFPSILTFSGGTRVRSLLSFAVLFSPFCSFPSLRRPSLTLLFFSLAPLCPSLPLPVLHRHALLRHRDQGRPLHPHHQLRLRTALLLFVGKYDVEIFGRVTYGLLLLFGGGFLRFGVAFSLRLSGGTLLLFGC